MSLRSNDKCEPQPRPGQVIFLEDDEEPDVELTVRPPTPRPRPATYTKSRAGDSPTFRNPRFVRGAAGLLQTTPTTRLPAQFSHKTEPAVRDAIDITDDFNNFGGGVNPLGYKGHTFTGTGYGPVTPPPRPTPALNKPTTAKSRRETRISFSDMVTTETNKSDLSYDNAAPSAAWDDGPDFLCPLFGPVDPFFAPMPLVRFLASNIVSGVAMLVWKTLSLLLCMSAMVYVCTQRQYPSFPSTALSLSVVAVASVIQFARALQYVLIRRNSTAQGSVNIDVGVTSLELLMCQAAPVAVTVLGLIVPLVVQLRFTDGDGPVGYYRSLAFILVVLVLASLLMDIPLTPGLSRVTYILPVTLLLNCLVVAGVWGAKNHPLVQFSFLSTGCSLVFGLLLHCLSRAVYIASVPALPSNPANSSFTPGKPSLQIV